ncbi:Large terminase phage packaging protein [Kaistia soli DSM 19436]|uniref:Large terminase phage packaging protein n=1 Tax=Kaistia soli DSM 19436 TaxID=1122133 RepID=A0A1M5MQF0_9HYPH|nr:terminase family protein [Kaistia soli]SHG79427.1 Large terminase phage packaging protein [Kaistia soli DSM 19436]
MTHSLIGSLASLPEADRLAVIQGLSNEQAEAILVDWRLWARPQQVAPPGDWQTWLVLAGRGFGKTRTGAEWVREKVLAGCGRVALIAPTASDARDVMVEGESGLLSVCWRGDRTIDRKPIGRPIYEPSKRRLTWANGAVATLFSAEEPERLRGPQHEAMWCDELAAWKYLRETWDMAMFGLRLGDAPQVTITTTPKPLRILREIMKSTGTVITRGSTFDNRANLAPVFLDKIVSKYEGTRLGRQELEAEIMEEAEGALWSRAMVEAARFLKPLPEMKRVVVAVDPAVTDKEDSAETGIVAAGLGTDDRGYVLADRSGRRSPGDWAKKAIELFRDLGADRIVAEGNQGGDLVAHAIRTVDPRVPVTIVHASRGKAARAEPVAALYEQGKVTHWKPLPDLEDQMVNWEPLSGMPSPDRLDALVWALTELMLKPAAPAPVVSSYSTRR